MKSEIKHEIEKSTHIDEILKLANIDNVEKIDALNMDLIVYMCRS